MKLIFKEDAGQQSSGLGAQAKAPRLACTFFANTGKRACVGNSSRVRGMVLDEVRGKMMGPDDVPSPQVTDFGAGPASILTQPFW